jgi:3'(2'), 5'-bisphosphate nucleotidase
MEYYQTDLPVEFKRGQEPVTAADRAADVLIAAGLRAAFPGDGLLTEESLDDGARLEKRRVWIVDPLDGTTEFISKTGDFAVQIALTEEGLPVLGVVYHPVTGRLYHALKGKGARETREGRSVRLEVRSEPDPAQMCLVASRSHYSDLVEGARQALGIEAVRRVGSVGLKVALLAQGECDVYLATQVSKEWDICAPHILLEEAGGTLTNLCGEKLTYNKPDVVECKGLIGSNSASHARIVDTLAPLLEQMEGQ